MTARTGRWWLGAVGYEVYVRSFADGDGDGIGDLAGLAAHVDHLETLGVDIVWVTPFYPSPGHDHGYDVADYRDVADVFGSLADVDVLAADLHRRGMRLLVDLVPNHTSSEHPWFRAARSARDDPHRDFYVWRDPAPDGGPPNNWTSHFGGRAWTFDETTGQYYLHLFLPEQPDLNWAHPAVHDAFEGILRFWLDRGVDGFRIDVAHALVKHPDLPDQPTAEVPDDVEMGSTTDDWESLQHIYDTDQPGVVDVYRRWRAVADEYGAALLGEVYVLDADRLGRYLTDRGLHLAFWFGPLHVRWGADRLRGVLREGTDVAARVDGDLAWVQGSHDRSRDVARYGGGDVGRCRAMAVATLRMLLPGAVFLYQGEELGLDDPVLRPEDAQDPIAAREGEYGRSRDVARTPLPWAPGPGYGFTTGDRTWLPFGDHPDSDTAVVQAADPRSPLSTYRRLIAVRRGLSRDVEGHTVEWLTDEGPLVAYRRGPVVVVANCGAAAADLPLPRGAEVRFATAGGDHEGGRVAGVVSVEPDEALLLVEV